MKLKPLLLLAVCLISVFSAVVSASAGSAQSADALFQQGNELYGQEKYREALDTYLRITTENGVSGPLLYNIANCYAQLGKTGKAVVNYKRALRLSPQDPDSKGNLELIRKQQGLFPGEIPLHKRLGSALSLDQWTLLAFIAYFLLVGIGLAGCWYSRGKTLQRRMSGAALLVLIIAAIGAFSQYRQLNEAVVIGSDAHLLLSPFSAASPVGNIQEGRIVHPLAQHGTFSLVEDETGRTGWIEAGAIESVLETAPLTTATPFPAGSH